MINFKKIDYNNPKLWADSRENNRLFCLLNQLRQRKIIKFTCELYLDNGVKFDSH